jgi:hypothetical protein
VSDQSDLLVLHTLRVKGMCAPDAFPGLTGLDPSQVSAALTTAVVSGFATVKEGRMTVYRLTPDGKEAAAKLLADSMDPASVAAAEKLYEAFIPLNDDLKALTTDWQMRNGEPNDHSDPAYEAAVIGRLAAVASAISDALPQAGDPLGRMALYRTRFDSALARVQAGENAAFARPMADSFHDAWMELHQDLLLSLNRERSAADGH